MWWRGCLDLGTTWGRLTCVLLRDVGPRALLVEVDGPGQAHAVAAWARARGGVVEVVPGATTVLLDGVHPDGVAGLRAALADLEPGTSAPEGPLVEVPVVYDGADLDDVARAWGTDRDGVVDLHTSLELTAAFCGFAPGFAYLAGLPAERAVTRLDSPRTRVPAGSVALAGTWCAVYPHASPGGWRLLGRTDLTLWDVERDDPALIGPGTRVRFVAR